LNDVEGSLPKDQSSPSSFQVIETEAEKSNQKSPIITDPSYQTLLDKIVATLQPNQSNDKELKLNLNIVSPEHEKNDITLNLASVYGDVEDIGGFSMQRIDVRTYFCRF
jgi:hypothetical protein